MEIFYYAEIQENSRTYDAHKLIIENLRKRDLRASIDALSANWKDTLEIFKKIYKDEKLRNENQNYKLSW